MISRGKFYRLLILIAMCMRGYNQTLALYVDLLTAFEVDMNGLKDSIISVNKFPNNMHFVQFDFWPPNCNF